MSVQGSVGNSQVAGLRPDPSCRGDTVAGSAKQRRAGAGEEPERRSMVLGVLINEFIYLRSWVYIYIYGWLHFMKC
jgi:hypothetical protein